MNVEGGKLRYSGHGQQLGKLGTTAGDGAFRLPSEVDPWVLVVAHDSGYAEVTAAEFAKSSTVRLKPWGRIEGEFVVDGKPVAGQAIHIGAGRGRRRQPALRRAMSPPMPRGDSSSIACRRSRSMSSRVQTWRVQLGPCSGSVAGQRLQRARPRGLRCRGPAGR